MVRLACALLIGGATSLLLGGLFGDLGWAVRAIAGWDVTSVTLSALAWWVIARADAQETRLRAAAEDPGRNAVSALVLVASTFSLFAAAVVLRRAKTLAPKQEALLVVLCLVAVLASWLLTHTAYTLRYAHLYYREGVKSTGGLVFPGNLPPDDFDFAYFSFTVGMCFQVSDVSVQSRAIRRAVLGHSLLAYAYNTVIVALALNLLFGLVN